MVCMHPPGQNRHVIRESSRVVFGFEDSGHENSSHVDPILDVTCCTRRSMVAKVRPAHMVRSECVARGRIELLLRINHGASDGDFILENC